MATGSRVIRDRRMISRVSARLNCRFTYQGVSREAVVIDLSLNGAYLAAKFLPPNDGGVTITLKTPPLKNALILEGKVIRGAEDISDRGSLGKFGIKFNQTSLDLIRIINRLAAKPVVMIH
jgi:PilZ domain